MSDREKLIELIIQSSQKCDSTDCNRCKYWNTNDCGAARMADFLLKNGVIVTPCIAMVEQFIKDGKFDRKNTAHNGRYAVVYIDNTKWGDPLIDITEQFYDAEKATERVRELKAAEKAIAERTESL